MINVGRAGIQLVQTAVNLANMAPKLIGLAAGLAISVCTFNFIAAAAALISIFIPSGPSPEEMILEEIGKLREDMRKFQEYVDERFNMIDKALNQIYVDVITKLDKIDLDLRKIDLKVDWALEVLASHSAALERIDRNLLEYLKEGERQELREAMRSALLRPSRSDKPTMSGAEYQAFEAKFLSWAIDKSRGPLEAPVGQTGALDLFARLDPDGNGGSAESMALADHLALAAKAVQDRGWRRLTSEPGQKVPNPRTWMIAAGAFTQLESEWPQLAARFNSKDLNGRRKQVRAAGIEIANVLDNIEKVKDDQGRCAIDRAVEDVQAAADNLALVIEETARAWRWNGLPVYVDTPLPPAPEFAPAAPPPGPGTDIPIEVVRRIPTIYRAIALSPKQTATGPPQPRGGLGSSARVENLGMVDDEGGRYARLELTINYRTSFGFTPIQKVVVTGRWLGRVPPDLPSQWPVFAERLKAPDAQTTNVASRDTTAQAARDWRLVRETLRRDGMLPALVNDLRRDGPLWNALAAYGGSRALLALLVGLAMPRARQRSDRLRAAFDGLPKSYGGIAIPTPDQIAFKLADGSMAEVATFNPDTRPLEDFLTRQVADALWGLTDCIKVRRETVKPAHRQDPAMAECFARLDLSRAIVHAADKIAKLSSTPTTPA